MKDRDVITRKVKPERVKNILEDNGSEISHNQAIQITDFVYTIAETPLRRGAWIINPKGERVRKKGVYKNSSFI